MTWFAVDIESNGAAPGLFSMTSFGAVAVRPGLTDTFYRELKPLPDAGCNPDALAVAGMSMEYLEENGQDPIQAMTEFSVWLAETSIHRPTLVSDNNSFDGSFITYYFALAKLDNPFGHSSRRIGDLWAGFKSDSRKHTDWKSLRTGVHDHNALNDAKGNGGALLKMAEMGLHIPECPKGENDEARS